ncbi:MAG: hypothetical protein K2Y37_15130 [Pirellulales bacterium]|nr:hypothetical protein [Pirellulales bacterium]
MPTQLDVYRDWLKIEEAKRPLNHYQLLKLKKFEDDPVRIRHHYKQLNAHVRKYQAGEFARQSQELLNELARAMLCLTDAGRKGDYDATLGRVQTGKAGQRTIEQLVIARKVVDQAGLDKAKSFADAVGVGLEDALVQQKLAKPEIIWQVYAESRGLPYVDLAETGVDPEWVAQVPAVLARQHSCVPVMLDDGQLLMASPHPLKPDVEDDLRLRLGVPVRSVLCTATGVNAAIERFFTKEAAAAELAAGPKKVAAAAPAAGKGAPATKGAAPAKAAAKAEAAESTMTREERMSQARKVALVAFNFGAAMTILYLEAIKSPPMSWFLAIPAAIMVGGTAAGLGFMVISKKK